MEKRQRGGQLCSEGREREKGKSSVRELGERVCKGEMGREQELEKWEREKTGKESVSSYFYFRRAISYVAFLC